MKKNTVTGLNIFLLLICCTALVVSCTSLNIQKNQKNATPKQPNFLFVLVDDQPFDAMGNSWR